MRSLRDVEFVGWRFWLICVVLGYGPCFYGVWNILVDETRSTTVPYVLALICSAIASSFVAVIVNSILQRGGEKKDQD